MFIQLLFDKPLTYLMIIAVVVVSICLHELGHALAASAYGDDTAKKAGFLTVNPFVQMGVQSLLFLLLAGIAWGVTPINPLRIRASQSNRFTKNLSETVVALSGIAINFLVMLLCVLALYTLNQSVTIPNPYFNQLLLIGAQYNGVLLLLNLLPIPPLDGYAALEPWVPLFQKSKQNIAQYGFFALIVLFFVFRLGYWMFTASSMMSESLYRVIETLLTH